MITLTAKFQLKYPDVTDSDLNRLREVLSLTKDDASDAFLRPLFLRASSAVEEFCSRVYRRSPWRIVFGGAGKSAMLPLFPVSSITSVTADGGIVDVGQWSIIPCSGGWRIDLKSPVAESLIVDVIAGYGDDTVAPAVFDAVVLAVAADMYEHRESQSEINLAENKTIKSAMNSLMFYCAG